MQEREMVLDILCGTKASLGTYAKVITECNDPNLRQTFQQMRNSDEQFQYDLYKIAAQKGYYTPAPIMNSNESQQIKATLSTALSQSPTPTMG